MQFASRLPKETPVHNAANVQALNSGITNERFINQVAVALGRLWYEDRASETGVDPYSDGICEEFRQESEAAILAYLDILEKEGYRIVRANAIRD